MKYSYKNPSSSHMAITAIGIVFQLILIVCKISGAIATPWIFVFAPLWVGPLFLIIISILAIISIIIGGIIFFGFFWVSYL